MFTLYCAPVTTQVLKVKPSLWPFILQPTTSDLEHFVDVPLSSDSDSGNDDKVPVASSQDHVTKISDNVARDSSSYQIMNRNPLYCKAETSCLWELNRVS